MAKCSICNSRKGKRKCDMTGTMICSQCCGETKAEENCTECSFFKNAAAVVNYRRLPYFSTREMESQKVLQSAGMMIEGTIVRIWNNNKNMVNDRTVLRLIEMLLDRYHFGRESIADDPLLWESHVRLVSVIEQDIELPKEDIVKVLGSVYRSVQRHTQGGREYLYFIRRFVQKNS